MTELKWEEPPGAEMYQRNGRGKHAAIAAQLKERPGQWAVIDTFSTVGKASSMGYLIRKARRMPAYAPAGAFEAKARTVDGEHRLYARYVGEQTP